MQQDSTMSFAQALNEAKGVIIQLSNRVKVDAEKIRTQQQTIVSQGSSIAQHEQTIEDQKGAIGKKGEEIAALTAKIAELEAAREATESMINRQGEKIRTLESAKSELEGRLGEHKTQIAELSRECAAIKSQIPSQDDAAALASMAALLAKAAPAIEKAKKAGPTMRLADESIAEAA